MQNIKVITTRCFKGYHEGNGKEYLKELYKYAQSSEHGKKLINVTSYHENYPTNGHFHLISQDKIVTISTWNKLQDWESWLRSEERKNIHHKYERDIEEESHKVLTPIYQERVVI